MLRWFECSVAIVIKKASKNIGDIVRIVGR